MGLLSDYLPNYLPQDPNQNAAARQGLLNFGAAMLGGRGNFGSILGQGLQAGAGGYNSTLSALQQKALLDAQTRHMGLINDAAQAESDQNKAIASAFADSAQPPAPGAAASLLAGNPASPSQSTMPTPSAAPDAGQSPMAPQAGAAPVPAVSALPQMGASAPSQQAPTQAQQSDLSQKYMAMGDKIKQFPAKAKIYYDLAEKFKPEVFKTEVLIDPTTKQPVQVTTFKDGSQKTSAYGALPDIQMVDLKGKTVAIDKNRTQDGKSFDYTQSPDSIARIAFDRQQAASGDQAPITDAAILNAAGRYNLDGTLPPMGMGKNAAAGRSAILNKAAELASGIDPTQQRRDQLDAKNQVASQGAAVKAFTSGKLGNTVRSFNVLQSHLDTFGNMADALNNGDMQAINQLGNAWSAKTGKAAPTNFEAIKHIVGDEIVKAVTGSAGALGDREAAAKTIASINSPAQLRGVIDSYRELAQGQINGLQQQYEQSTGKKDFNRFLSPNALESREVGKLPQKTGHPPDIASLLDKYGAH